MTRDLRFLSLSLMIWGIGEGMFIYFQPLYLQQLGADPVEIGAILGAAGVVMSLAHIPAGALADHWGPKRLMVAGWSMAMFATWVMFLAPSLPFFVAGLLLYSMTLFLVSPMSAYITAARGTWTVARALTTLSATYNVGASIGPLIGGQLGENMGLRSAYGTSACLFVVSTLLLLFIRHQAPLPSPDRSRYRSLLARSSFQRFLVLIFAAAVGMYLSWPLTPNFLRDVRQVPLATIGVFGSSNAFGIVVLNLTFGRFAPRLGYLFAQSLVGLSVLLLWQGSGAPWFALGYFLSGGFRTARSLVTAQVETLVQRSERGLAYGLAETVQGTALAVAPPVAGLLYHQEPALPFPASLGIIGAMLLLTARYAPRAAGGDASSQTHLAHLGDARREDP